VFIFLIKVVAGIVYGVINFYDYGGGDTGHYFGTAFKLYNLIGQDNSFFVQLVFTPNIGPIPPAFEEFYGQQLLWTNEGSYLMVRIHLILHFFSLHYYYIHTLFFAFASYIGCLAIYKFIAAQTAYIDKNYVILILNLYPSFVYWTSGMHKESIELLWIGGILYSLGKSYHNGWSSIKIILLCCCSLLLAYLRIYVFIIFFMPIFSWLLLRNTEKKYFLKFMSLSILLYSIAIFTIYVLYNKSPLEYLSLWQSQFINEPGVTHLLSQPLAPTLAAYIQYLPTALYNLFFHPTWSECHKLIRYIQFFDNWLYIFLLLLICCKIVMQQAIPYCRIQLMLLIIAISYIILLGYVVSTYALICRYKAIPLMLLLLLILLSYRVENRCTKN